MYFKYLNPIHTLENELYLSLLCEKYRSCHLFSSWIYFPISFPSFLINTNSNKNCNDQWHYYHYGHNQPNKQWRWIWNYIKSRIKSTFMIDIYKLLLPLCLGNRIIIIFLYYTQPLDSSFNFCSFRFDIFLISFDVEYCRKVSFPKMYVEYDRKLTNWKVWY